MSTELKIPAVGESVSEVQIGEWHKAEGDDIARDENVVTIESDKANVELPAPAAGTLAKILKHTGETVKVGEAIAQIEEGGKAPPAKTEPKPEIKQESKSETDEAEEPRPETKASTSKPVVQATEKERPQSKPPTNGKNGGNGTHTEPKPAPSRMTTPVPAAPAIPSAGREEEVVPMSALRRMAARRLVGAQHVAALLTTINEIDMSNVMALRKEFGEKFHGMHGAKLGFMSFFVKAAIDALKRVPQLNAQVRDTDIIYHRYYDIGVAIGGGKGLVVPVLRNADRISFAETEKAIADFAHRARESKLLPYDLAGGTFTITNGGVYGSLLSTPIVNPPQSGILGMHSIQERPIALNDNIVIRPMMYVALTYDHRIVDGKEAVTFLKRIKEAVENPARMLIEA